jgi:uncharacterized protein (TIGR02145 family)
MKQTKIVFLFAVIVIFVGACSPDENSDEINEEINEWKNEEKIELPDGTVLMRIGNHDYLTFVYGETRWMVQNSKEGTYSGIAYGRDAKGKAVGSFANSTDIYDGQENGYYYTVDQAASACPSGWGLPTKDEWDSMWQIMRAGTDGTHIWWYGAKGIQQGAFAGSFFYSHDGWEGFGYYGAYMLKPSVVHGITWKWVGVTMSATGFTWNDDNPLWCSVRCVQR